MSTVTEFERANMLARQKGEAINLTDVIYKYIEFQQRATALDIKHKVYDTIGTKYKSTEFDAKIGNIVKALEKEGNIRIKDGYYTTH